MTWTDAVCLMVGRVVLGLGGVALACFLALVLLDYIFKRTRNFYLVVQWAMDKKGRERVKRETEVRAEQSKREREVESSDDFPPSAS